MQIFKSKPICYKKERKFGKRLLDFFMPTTYINQLAFLPQLLQKPITFILRPIFLKMIVKETTFGKEQREKMRTRFLFYMIDISEKWFC